MSGVVKGARWLGFGLGYSLVEAGALAVAGVAGGPGLMLLVAHVANILFLLIVLSVGARALCRWVSARKGRPAGPLGTYAKSGSQGGAGAEGSGAAG